MKISLTNVSINYSPKLPEVILEVTKVTIDMVTNMADVEYTHSIPTYSPTLGTGEIVIDKGDITLPVPEALQQGIMQTLYAHIQGNYGN